MAPLDYATLGSVKTRLGITDTTDDTLLTQLVADMNAAVEDITGRAIGPLTITNELLDGYDALEEGRCLPYPKGIRSITTLEVASTTGGTFSTVPAGDVFLRPHAGLRQPDWPAFEIWMSDIPAASNTLPVFLPGYANIRLTGAAGWAAIPSTLTKAAETTVARWFVARNSGGEDAEGSDDVGLSRVTQYISGQDLATIRRYQWRSVEIV